MKYDVYSDGSLIYSTDADAPQLQLMLRDGERVAHHGSDLMLSDDEWADLVSPAPQPQYPRFVGNAKLDLFTRDEQLAVVTATMSDPMVKLFYDRMLGAAYLSYEDPETEQGLALLESKGLLTAERKAEIVAAMQPA